MYSVCVCVCVCVSTSRHEFVKLRGFDRMALSDCMHACTDNTLPTVSLPQLPGG